MDAEQRVTRAGCRTVLVMVPTMTAGTRLLDLAMLLQDDHRVQVLFTVPETYETWHGTEEFVRGHGGLVIPWHQAVAHRFDLALAASYAELDRVRGRVLVVPHGASSLMSRRFSRSAGPSAMPHAGLARETLTRRGRVIPSVIALTHDVEREALRRSCPEALPNAVVAGDICFDRMVASQPLRENYRRALGLSGGQLLVTVSSTWSTESAFGRYPELCRGLLEELPDAEYRVAAVLHPSIWAVHGRWQVQAWLAGCIRDGLLVIPPEEGWRAAMVACDWVIGDYGSTTQYAAALGRPVLLAAFPKHAIRPGSVADALAAAVPMLEPDRPVLPQLRRAAQRHAHHDGAIAHLITSRPARSAAILRRAMYDLLELPEPMTPAETPSVPVPRPIRFDHDPGRKEA